MERALTSFIRALRTAGAAVSTAEAIDAARAIDVIGYRDRQSLKHSLGIVLAKSKLHGLWDDVPGKITTNLLAGAGATQARQLPPTTGGIADWPAQWATDTLQAAPQAFQGLKIGAKVNLGQGDQWPASAEEPAYRRARENLQQAQMVKAGARLAQILTTVLP